jgi:hypothetical protein
VEIYLSLRPPPPFDWARRLSTPADECVEPLRLSLLLCTNPQPARERRVYFEPESANDLLHSQVERFDFVVLEQKADERGPSA